MLLKHTPYLSLTMALMLMTLAGCSTTVKAPFELPETEWTQPAAADGLLAQIEADMTARAEPLGRSQSLFGRRHFGVQAARQG